MAPRYFEDLEVGVKFRTGTYEVTEAAVTAFAAQWDQQPQHTDPQAAEASYFGGLIAPGVFTMAVAIRLVTQASDHTAMIAAAGWDEVRFLRPVKPGDALTLEIECVDTRPSRSRPDRGLVRHRFTMTNQTQEPVLTFEDLVVVRRRPGVSSR